MNDLELGNSSKMSNELAAAEGMSRNFDYCCEIRHSLFNKYFFAFFCQACFVNTKGKVDSHVPADHQMEWLVKMNKQHIKHMFSNKKETTIEKKSAAIPGVADIAGNFDKESSVVIRAKKHSEKSAHNDELTMLRELRLVKPFAYTPGRTYSTFQKVQPSMLCHLNAGKFKQWFVKKKCTFTP